MLWRLKQSAVQSNFNPKTPGARAFNAVMVQRAIDEWIDKKTKSPAKKSGPAWGVLVHGDRILSTLAFRALGVTRLAELILWFAMTSIANLMHPLRRHVPK